QHSDDPHGAVGTLERLSRRRKRSGWVLFCFLLVLAGLTAGTGWYFGSGPGSLVSIPAVAGQSQDDAKAILEQAGFTVETASIYSLSIDEGIVADTIPAAGTAVAKEATITIEVSRGPQPIELPKLSGLSLEDATKAIT